MTSGGRRLGKIDRRFRRRCDDGSAAVDRLTSSDSSSSVVRSSLEDGLSAHYAFESAVPAALEDLPPPRPPRIPPASLIELARNPFSPEAAKNETDAERRKREAAQSQARVPRNYNADELFLSRAETPGVSAAVIQTPIFRAGVVGQALYFDETNKGFLGRDVGWYDRSNPFSLDFWFVAAETYDSVPVINHMAENNSGRTGYKVSIKEGRLWIQFAHSPPANMIALETVKPTMYTFVKRNALHPALRIFDFMNRTTSIARRRTSNTPLQALDLMNDPQYVEAYRMLAASVLAAVEGERPQIERLYRIATRTMPSDAMVDRLQQFFAAQKVAYSADPDKADALLDIGVSHSGGTDDPVTLAAFTNVAMLVMNSPDAYIVR